MKKTSPNQNQDPFCCDPAELFKQFGSAVYGYALGVFGTASDAEEVVSETFLRICKHNQQFRGQGTLKAWVFGIAHRLCIDSIRAKGRKLRTVSLSEQLRLPDRSHKAQEDEHERQQMILAAIDKLAAEQKEVIMLKIYGGLTFRQISEVLGIPLNTALGRMHQGLKHLRRDPRLNKIAKE